VPTSYTLEDLVAEESQALGDNFTGTTTAAGAATGLTLVSTSLLTRGGQGWHPAQVEITSGARDGDIRPTDFFAVSGQVATLTMQVAFGGQIDTGSDAITFRIHFIDPLLKREAVDEALRIASAKFPLYFSQDLLAGELLRNHSFEYWRTPSRLYDWEYVAGTLAREGTTVREGKYAASLTGTGSAGSVRLRIDLGMELNGVLLTFTCYNRVAASAAATQRISLQQGGTTGNSAGLSSLNTWTLQTATLTPSDPYQPIYAILSNITAQAVLYDQARLSVASGNDVAWVPITEALMHLADLQVGPNADDTPTATRFLHPHPLPGPIDRARGYAYFNRDLVNPVAWSDANASNLVLPRNQHLRLTGHARWPVLSALSDTIDLTEEQKDYIGVLAGIHAIYKALGSRYLANEAAWEAQGKRLEQRVALLEAKAVESATPIATQIWW
jgi:hypothetical protein